MFPSIENSPLLRLYIEWRIALPLKSRVSSLTLVSYSTLMSSNKSYRTAIGPSSILVGKRLDHRDAKSSLVVRFYSMLLARVTRGFLIINAFERPIILTIDSRINLEMICFSGKNSKQFFGDWIFQYIQVCQKNYISEQLNLKIVQRIRFYRRIIFQKF